MFLPKEKNLDNSAVSSYRETRDPCAHSGTKRNLRERTTELDRGGRGRRMRFEEKNKDAMQQTGEKLLALTRKGSCP